MSDETSIRDFVFIEDVVEAFRRLIPVAARQAVEVVNISTGVGIAVGIVVEEALMISKVSRRVPEHERHPDGSVSSIILDNSKLKRLTGWIPSTRLVEGIEKCIQHDKGAGEIN